MKQLLAWIACALAALATQTVAAQGSIDEEFRKLPWVMGPERGKVASQASIALDDKLMFLGEQGASRFLELAGNPPRPNHFVVVSREANWFAVFSFNPDGYVRDDEKIDADALLKSLRDSDEPGNEERKKLGLAAIYTDGWQTVPHYDTATKRLEWGVKLRTEDGKSIVNYTSRLLGREGVMSAVLVSSPESLEKDMVAFKQALTGFEFDTGKRYTEFREGDKVAAYGLGALVLGGAAAAAAKTGAGKAFGKLILGGLAAGGALIWGLFKRLTGRKES